MNNLEIVFIAKRVLLKKIAIMPEGETPKIHGSIVNVTVNVSEICNSYHMKVVVGTS